jgi:hypothetical protein
LRWRKRPRSHSLLRIIPGHGASQGTARPDFAKATPGQAAAPYRVGRSRPRSAHLSAVWGRNRSLCVNGLIHGHLCVSCFGRCRRVAHRYTFICQESVRNSGCGSPKIAGLHGTPHRPVHRTCGRDGPDQRGWKSLMSIHRSHICHIGGADQGLFHPPRNSRLARILRATQNRPTTAYGKWPSLPSWQAGFQPAGMPPAPPARTARLQTPTLHLPTPPQLERKRREVGGVFTSAASRRECHRRRRTTQQRRANGRNGLR